MNGVSKFDPLRPGVIHASSGIIDQKPIDKVVAEINDAIHYIREWQTLMNIFGFKNWRDPLTSDVHIVLRAQKAVALENGEHIGAAVEKESDQVEVVVPPSWVKMGVATDNITRGDRIELNPATGNVRRSGPPASCLCGHGETCRVCS